VLERLLDERRVSDIALVRGDLRVPLLCELGADLVRVLAAVEDDGCEGSAPPSRRCPTSTHQSWLLPARAPPSCPCRVLGCRPTRVHAVSEGQRELGEREKGPTVTTTTFPAKSMLQPLVGVVVDMVRAVVCV
jgi:hypothetical protein